MSIHAVLPPLEKFLRVPMYMTATGCTYSTQNNACTCIVSLSILNHDGVCASVCSQLDDADDINKASNRIEKELSEVQNTISKINAPNMKALEKYVQ